VHPGLTRREALVAGVGSIVTAAVGGAQTGGASALQRAVIPSSKTSVARVGLGTWQTFDVGRDTAKRAQLSEVLSVFTDAGASVVDTSPMYGTSEEVLGDLVRDTGLRAKLFLATKVWTQGERAGIDQMNESFRLLRTDRVELMQIHNLLDRRVHIRYLRKLKEQGKAAHIGVTHYTQAAANELAKIIREESVDFVQFALSLDEPEATTQLLAACWERGVAFLANRPFGGGGSFAKTRGKALPPWAKDLGIESWAQFLLKWVLSHPEVTCAIPGTGKPEHMRDNLAAARGPLPDAAARARMRAAWAAL